MTILDTCRLDRITRNFVGRRSTDTSSGSSCIFLRSIPRSRGFSFRWPRMAPKLDSRSMRSQPAGVHSPSPAATSSFSRATSLFVSRTSMAECRRYLLTPRLVRMAQTGRKPQQGKLSVTTTREGTFSGARRCSSPVSFGRKAA